MHDILVRKGMMTLLMEEVSKGSLFPPNFL